MVKCGPVWFRDGFVWHGCVVVECGAVLSWCSRVQCGEVLSW